MVTDNAQEKFTEVFLSVKEINGALHHLLRSIAEEAGLTPLQLSILGAISRGHDLKVTDVADKVCMSGSAVSIASDQLVQMGLVERTRHRDDRRIVGLTLTEEGTRKLGSIHHGDSLYSDCLSKLQGFSADEVTQMLDTHKKLMKIFKQGA